MGYLCVGCLEDHPDEGATPSRIDAISDKAAAAAEVV
jgi:hypothetical protein